MTRIEEAEKKLEEVQSKYDELRNKLYENQRIRGSINEKIEKQLDGEYDIDKLTELKAKREAATDIINKLAERVKKYEEYNVKPAEEELERVKKSKQYHKNSTGWSMVKLKLEEDKLEDAKREVERIENGIKNIENDIEHGKELYKNNCGEELEISEKKINEGLYLAKATKAAGVIVDKKFDF
ncbi:MAG: hypothetical protein ACOCRK_01545 [bacterium]